MKKYEINQRWDKHLLIKHFGIEDDKVVYTYTIETFENCFDFSEVYLSGVYVDEAYRNKGYFNKIMEEVLDNYNNILIKVFRDYFIMDKYKKLGFEIIGDDNDDNDYVCMKYEKWKKSGFQS